MYAKWIFESGRSQADAVPKSKKLLQLEVDLALKNALLWQASANFIRQNRLLENRRCGR